jgi:hypothetical protein
MNIQEVAQTKNYIKQNIYKKQKKKQKIEKPLFLFFPLFFFIFCLFVLFLYNFKNFYNLMNGIFVINRTLTLFSSLRGILIQLVVWRSIDY